MNWAIRNRDTLDQSHYTVLSKPKHQYFINLYPNELEAKKLTSNGQLRIIAIGDESVEWDYFDIPFSVVADVLTEATLTNDERWLIQIINEQFTVFPGGEGTSITVPVGEYYRIHHLPTDYI